MRIDRGLDFQVTCQEQNGEQSYYFRTDTVFRTISHNGRDVTSQCQVGGHVEWKKIMNMPNGDTQVVQNHFLK